MKPIFSRIAGYALVQTIFTMIMAGVFVGVVLALVDPFVLLYKKEPREITQERIQIIQEALSIHVENEGFLPCPASVDAVPDTAEYGRAADCTNPVAPGVTRTNTGRAGRFVRIGAVPTRSLNIADKYIQDRHGKLFVYAVTEVLTARATYSNSEGGIFVIDASDTDVTTGPGVALYAVVSYGQEGDTDNCQAARSEGENCDEDAVFREDVLSLNPFSNAYYDDIAVYSEMEPKSRYGLCGTKGKVYAPEHPESDDDECLDVTLYAHYQKIKLPDSQIVNCTLSNQFCDGDWFDILDMRPGDYLIHWDGFLQFKYPQPSQYGLIEFEVDGQIEQSHQIPFVGNVCDPAGLLQHEKGMVEFDIEDTAKLRGRVRIYGGNNDPATFGCPGQTPALQLMQQGAGDLSALKALSIDAFRRAGGGGAGAVPPDPIGGDGGGPVAFVKDMMGGVFVEHTDTSTEPLSVGASLEMGDKLIVGMGSSLEIIFVDGTSFFLAENTQLVIDDYLFDPATGEGNSFFSILRGVFLYISGLIPKENVTIDIAYGEIGIRGTTVFGEVDIMMDRAKIVLIDGIIEVTSNSGVVSLLSTQYEAIVVTAAILTPVAADKDNLCPIMTDITTQTSESYIKSVLQVEGELNNTVLAAGDVPTCL